MAKQGQSFEDQFNCPVVRPKAKKEPPKPKKTSAQKVKIAKAILGGMSVTAAARKFNTSEGQAWWACTDYCRNKNRAEYIRLGGKLSALRQHQHIFDRAD